MITRKNKAIYFIAAIAVCLLNSCMVNKDVVSLSAYNSKISELKAELENQGYILSGESNEVKNEMAVNGVSYSRLTGFGTAMQNNYWSYDEFIFADSANNTISFTTKYMIKESHDHVAYVDNLELVSCNASRDYSEICGGRGKVKSSIQEMNDQPDKVVKVYNTGGTAAAIIGGALGLSIFILIVALF